MLAPCHHDRRSRRLSRAYDSKLIAKQVVCWLHSFTFGREHAR